MNDKRKQQQADAEWLFRLAAAKAAEDFKRADEYDPLFRAVHPREVA